MKFVLMIALLYVTSAFADYTFLLRDKRYPERPFSVKLSSSNRAGVHSFESYLTKDGEVTVLDEAGNPEIGIISGRLIKARRTSQHDWDFTIDGRTLEFADMTTEVCDGQFLDIESDPEYWFKVVGRFCPWGTKGLVDEIRRNGKVIYLRH